MQVRVKINGEKIKLALLRDGYENIAEFCKKRKMTSGTVINALKNGECTYSTAFKLMDNLGIEPDDFIVTE